MDDKETLHDYLRAQRTSLLGKLDGLGEYDVRRPMTATGTNLLGLVKHVASVELGYFGAVFGRPSGRELPWVADDAEVNADMWATRRRDARGDRRVHRFSAAHSDATIEALPLDAPGVVPWWGERRDVTLHQVLVHMCTETARHADTPTSCASSSTARWGAGRTTRTSPSIDWPAYRERLEAAARQAEAGPTRP